MLYVGTETAVYVWMPTLLEESAVGGWLAASALTPDGEPDILAVLAALARRSATVGGLVRLARDSSAAFAALGRCRALLGVGLGVPDLGELLRDVA